MLEILQVPPFLAAEICELGMVITMLADSFLAQFGLFCLDVCWFLADFTKLCHPGPRPKKKNPSKMNPSRLSTGELWFPGPIVHLGWKCKFHVEFYFRGVACRVPPHQTEAFSASWPLDFLPVFLGHHWHHCKCSLQKAVNIMTQLISKSRPVPKRSKGYIPGGYSTILHDQYSGIPATLVGLLNMTSIWFILGLAHEDKITIDNPCHPCMAKFLPTLIPYKSTIHVGKQTSPMDGTVDGSEILHQLRKR